MKRTAFDKIVIGFVLFVIIIFSVLVFYTIHNTQDRLYDRTKDNLTSAGNMLVKNPIASYLSQEKTITELTEYIKEASKTLQIDIWLADETGEIKIAPENKEYVQSEINISSYLSNDERYNNFTKEKDMNGYYSEDMLCAGFPVYYNGNYAGILVLCSSLEFMHDVVTSTIQSTYMPFFILIILSLIALMGISNSMLKPLREIIRVSKSYAAGNFNAKANIPPNNEFGELAQYMEEMADELSRSNEYKKSFISNISHDFRSPLTSIKGYIEAMLDGTIPPEKHEKYLNIVLNETQRLTKLTQGLLELNSFDSFDLKLDKSNFDLKSIITPTINTFEGKCQDRGIYLKSIFLTDNTVVYADRTRIQQVIYNLIDNAIKFTPEGKQIIVQVSEKGDKIYTSVKDEGCGIPKESIKKVFDRFYKTDPSRGKDKMGTGLGLAITKEVIKAHGEKITLTSEVGKGSEFIFSLPMQKEMQVPIKPVHIEKKEEEFISNGKFRIKKN
ncbi:MAG: ATP-binding protein [Coprococcus sp.]